MIIFGLVLGNQLIQPKSVYAVDGDDVQNTTNFGTNVVTTGETIWDVLSKEVLEPAVQALANKMLDKLTQSTLTWANGGFDGDPSFINNWDDFLKGTEHELISAAFETASLGAQSVGGSFGGDIADIAQANYNLYQSGELNTKRAVATSVAQFGSEQLNLDPLASVINGEGETLTTLLGSQGAKDQFYNGNLTDVGGNDALKIYTAYIAATDKPNSTSGLNTLVKQTLGSEAENKITSVIQNVQTPEKFLDKKECSNGGEIVNGKCPEGEQLIATTPGGQVGDLVSNSLFKDTNQALNAKGLVGSLVNALGKLTSGLIDGGISKISKVAVGAFFDNGQQGTFSADNEFIQGGYQSQYNVLGIASNSTATTVNTSTGGDINDLFTSQNGQAPFLGGPEDLTDNWGEGPQVIIDFNKLLQININFAEEEYEYYEEMEQIIIDSKDSAIAMDQCLPGPDYDWENRWKDIMPSGDESSLGLSLTKKMFADSRVNIPGSKHIYSSFKNLVGDSRKESIRIALRLESLDTVRSTLSFIEAEIQGRFNIQKSAISEDLILFSNDWIELSSSQQEDLLQIAIDEGYYLLKTEEGETIQSAILNSNTKSRDAVLAMAWNLWRTETPQEEKNDLRYSFYILQTRLSSEQFLASAKAKLAQTRASAQSTEELLSDCLIFKAYALGTPVAELQTIVANSTGVSDAEAIQNQIQGLSQNINELGGAFFLGGPLGGAVADAIGGIFGLGGSGNLPDPYNFIDIDPHPSDQDIIDFLTTQNELTLLGDESALFNSTKMTSGGAIAVSILGFENEAEKLQYFTERYPDIAYQSGNYPSLVRTNAYSIYDIFVWDDYYIWIFGGDDDPNITGQVSTLYCQHNGIFGTGATDGTDIGGFGGEDHVNHSMCVKGNWSKASSLDYELIFAGIN